MAKAFVFEVSVHYNLRFSQAYVRKADLDRYLYIEHGSKTEMEDYKLEFKCVTIIASEGGGNHDHVLILDTYLSKVPPEMKIYLRPMQQVSGYEGAQWFYRQNIS